MGAPGSGGRAAVDPSTRRGVGRRSAHDRDGAARDPASRARADTDYALLGHVLRELLTAGADETYLRDRCSLARRAPCGRHGVRCRACRGCHRPVRCRADGPGRRGAPRGARLDRHRHRREHGCPRQRRRVVRQRAPAGHRLLRPARWDVVQPGSARPARRGRHRPAPEQARPTRPTEPPRASPPFRPVPVRRHGRRDRGREPPWSPLARRQPGAVVRRPGPVGSGVRPAGVAGRRGHPADGDDRRRDARAPVHRAVRAARRHLGGRALSTAGRGAVRAGARPAGRRAPAAVVDRGPARAPARLRGAPR